MTTLGQILVVINLLLSCCFMASAVAVYSTRQDLQGQLDSKGDQISQLQGAKSSAESELADARRQFEEQLAGLQQELSEAERSLQDAETQLTQVADEKDRLQGEAAKEAQLRQQASVETNQRSTEVEELRKTRMELLEKNRQLVETNADLQDANAELKSNLETVQARTNELQKRVGELESFILRFRPSLPTDAELADDEAPKVPPDVEGIVTDVDSTGRYLTLSLGTDNGIQEGQELEVWREGTDAKYLGKVKIFTAEATRSVAKPIFLTGSGRIQARDKVGPRLLK